ncbi:MAG: D-alanine--D-alanine ligase A, partial [Microthrixaceae bacterium]|nr:D-alanine--D-alanine ligase A [Microthrixaceae bacterium]
NEEPRVSVAGEIIPAADFYDFEDKYVDGAAKTIVPADLPPGAAEEMAELAQRSYRALRAEGLARVDMFYEEGGRGFLVNEINTFPGFTSISMFPMMWAASGLSYPDLLDEMIRLALERHARRRR